MLSRFRLAAAWLLCQSFLHLHTAAAAAVPASDISSKVTFLQALLTATTNKWATNTTIAFPGSAQYSDETERWTTFDAPTFAAVIVPGSEADAVAAVRLATKAGVPFLATGGRHGYTTTLGALQNGLAISLDNFAGVTVNSKARTTTIGGATRASQLLDPLYNAGFQIQMGSCSCVGFMGVALGGGIGRYQGLFGLVIDALVSLRMIIATGDVITVSATQNSDLFWGIKGAGFNYGVVLSATYNVQPLVNGGQVTNVDMIFPGNTTGAFFDALQTFQKGLPAKLATVTLINFNTTTAQTQVVSNWVYQGTAADARNALAPILAAGPTTADFTYVPWNKLLATSGFGYFDAQVCQKGVARDLYANVVRNISTTTYKQVYAQMDQFFADTPGALYSSVEFELFPNQAMLSVPDSSTAYPWRDALGYISQSYAGFAGSDTATIRAVTTNAQNLRSEFSATSGYSDLAIYVNYAHGDETLAQKYGQRKLAHLVALKKKWDPTNVFAYNNALPTSL